LTGYIDCGPVKGVWHEENRPDAQSISVYLITRDFFDKGPYHHKRLHLTMIIINVLASYYDLLFIIRGHQVNCFGIKIERLQIYQNYRE
jgi:hypothetical protein